jgi:molybdenum cofactor cytidylyltransferase
MVCQVAEPFLTLGLELLIVIGHERERVKEALDPLPCEYIINRHPEDGMFSSVRLGCRAVSQGEACLLSTCDCPGIQPTTIQRVQNTLQRNPANVVIPMFQGRRGHPAGLPAFLVDRIRTLPPETPGLNSLWRETPELVLPLEVNDPAILRDLDRPQDVTALHEALR